MFQLPKNEHTTLPSVENWNTNNNIQKLPAQAIFTRRKDKVGDNLQITEWIDESGDRVCEGVSKFARGVNPMVSVSYSNYNAGTSGNPLSFSSKSEASLPIKIMNGGAFRPPIQPIETLLPLSRLPRSKVSAQTHASFPSYHKKSHNPLDMRSVKEEILHTSVRPSQYINIYKDTVGPTYDVNDKIKENLQFNVTSNIRGPDNSTLNVQTPTGNQINNNNLLVNANTSYGSDYTIRRTIDSTNVSLEKAIEEALNTSITANISKTNETPIIRNADKGARDDILMGNISTNIQGDKKISIRNDIKELERNLPEYNVNSNVTGYNKYSYIGNEKELERNLPVYNVNSNISGEKKYTRIENIMDLERNIPVYNVNSNIKGTEQYIYYDNDIELERNVPVYNVNSNIYDSSRTNNLRHDKDLQLENRVQNTPAYSNPGSSSSGKLDTITSRQAYLPPSLNKGGFNNTGFVPTTSRQNYNGNLEPFRKNLKGVVNNMQQQRFNN